MPGSDLSAVMALASGVSGPPYDCEGAQELCNLLEQLLQTKLDADVSWSRWDWLDGFIPEWLERQSNLVFIRGEIWVNAVRPEPCEVELHLEEQRGVTIRFMDAIGLSTAKEPGRIKFPPGRDWRYVFILPDRGSAV